MKNEIARTLVLLLLSGEWRTPFIVEYFGDVPNAFLQGDPEYMTRTVLLEPPKELGLSSDQVEFGGETREESKKVESPSYPGLKAEMQLGFLEARLLFVLRAFHPFLEVCQCRFMRRNLLLLALLEPPLRRVLRLLELPDLVIVFLSGKIAAAL